MHGNDKHTIYIYDGMPPLPSNSHYQDDHIFSRGYQEAFMCFCSWEREHPNLYTWCFFTYAHTCLWFRNFMSFIFFHRFAHRPILHWSGKGCNSINQNAEVLSCFSWVSLPHNLMTKSSRLDSSQRFKAVITCLLYVVYHAIFREIEVGLVASNWWKLITTYWRKTWWPHDFDALRVEPFAALQLESIFMDFYDL